MYNNFISLGYNCEISFRLENFFGSINAMPFSWSYVLDRNQFIRALEENEKIFSGNVTLQEDHMFKCEEYQLKFHPRYDLLLKDHMSDTSIEAAKTELKNRVSYLNEKLKKLFMSDESTVFIIKVENQGDEDNIRFIQTVFDTINKLYLNQKFILVVAIEKSAISKGITELEQERLKIRTLNKFAPRKHTDIMGDIWGWWKILVEVSGEKNYKYFLRVNEKRLKWSLAVIKKKLKLK